MKSMILTLILLVASGSAFAADEAPHCTGSLDVVKFKDSSYEVTGDIVAEQEDSVTIIPENGGRITLRRDLIDEILYDAREPRRLTTENVVESFTSCLSRLVADKKIIRLIKVTSEAIFLNAGKKDGLLTGLELNVYREGEQIIDPETEKALGREKDLVGIIHLIGVEEDYSRAIPFNTPIEKFREGDTGAFLRKTPTLAVAKFTTLDGEESPYGSMISNQIIEKLNQNPELKLIEHKQLGFRLLDEIRGLKADALLVGTVADVDDGVAVNLRMVDTSTAAVLHSMRKVVQNPEKPVRPGGRKKEKSLTPRAKSGKGKAGSKSDSTTEDAGILDRLLRAIYDR
ncbi:MAG: hypothetical protein HQ583_01300 [Candidatus Abyssubacteria bacterium]|nr:hypothetical protein [Candidatus Abyssubacteria bacterium]